jgi:hypothetical protein
MFMRLFMFPLVFFLLAACASTTVSKSSQNIAVNDVAEKLEITVPQSKVVMSLPKNGLHIVEKHQGGATESPRYFYFEDSSAGVILSGWFEPASRYGDLQSSWNTEMQGLKKSGFGSPQNVEQGMVGSMRTILYNMPVPYGSNSHIRASYIGAGTWIDIHVSVTSKLPMAEGRKRVLDLVRAINFQEKP